jgi:NAD(P)-dependent dehydrogenase (short-subunit alcohol dehydrogenase family)
VSRERWGEHDIADQSGRVAVVTGASTGIGWETARALATAGARVLLGCRDAARGHAAIERLEAVVGNADVSLLPLDLADAESVHLAAEVVRATCDRVDLLVNNAAVMAPPLTRTADGRELQFATNHLGHFALTGLLRPLLDATPGSRVVTVSSLAHRFARVGFDDLDANDSYHPWARYAMTKVCNVLFALELQRRLDATGSSTASLACHPGLTRTELGRHRNRRRSARAGATSSRIAQPAAMGALPTLRAATDPAASGGQFYGPDGLGQIAGFPVRVHASRYANRLDVARDLWDVSRELTGVDQ